MADDAGYVNYFEVLDVEPSAKPGEVRNAYKRKMKALIETIRGAELTEERRNRFLLDMAKLNAALLTLRDPEVRDAYGTERERLIALEAEYRAAGEAKDLERLDVLRRQFDGDIKTFLSKYVEEAMAGALSDKECFEASHWDQAHARHASRILRHYRHMLYQRILERLPYTEVTPPAIDWDRRRDFVASLLK